jgi:hypothetical protein
MVLKAFSDTTDVGIIACLASNKAGNGLEGRKMIKLINN